MIASLYTDGGIIGRNPSSLGGTWAWVTVDHRGDKILQQSGVVLPRDAGLPRISNNYTELLAVVQGMEALSDGWAGTIWLDSFVTYCRIVYARAKFRNIPDALIHRARYARARLGPFKVNLLAGHPTQADLARGYRLNGTPASSWNVLCDQLCGEKAEAFRKGLLP